MALTNMTPSSIHIRDLHKTYVVSKRESGVAAALQSLVRRQTEDIPAVDGISFDLAPGEVVGFLGPNGAGKTTTLKMLSGLLHPTAGEITVLGYIPWKRDKNFLRQITLVMGQRNELVWDIPALDSFELNRAVYRVPPADYRRTLNELTELLELGELLRKPVRNLSLGERMKCEIAAALLHRPQMIFLRVIVIHNGRLLFDGELSQLVEKFTAHKTIVVQLADVQSDLRGYGEVVSREEGHITLRVPKAETARITERLLVDLPVIDLLVEDPPIEEIIERVFAQEDS